MPNLRALIALLTPSERRTLTFLIGWALLGFIGRWIPWTASFAAAGDAAFEIPADDPRAELHRKSTELAAHLAVARTPPERPLDPNVATPPELDRLPGVGPRTALRWASERASGGPFFAPLDLRRVKGLGAKRIAALESYLTFPPATGRGAARARSGRVDLNRASERELEALPGVGPALAARIVERRRNHGRYGSLADLDSVPGVGPALLERLASKVGF